MDKSTKFLSIIGTMGGLFGLLGVLLAILIFSGFFLGFIPLGLFLLYYGWIAYTFFHYRQLRQEELLHVLTTAVAAQAPLVPVLEAYLRDRSGGTLRQFWVAFLQFFMLPGYYWIWHHQNQYDRKVGRLIRLLEQGYPLAQALQEVPGLASGAMKMAASVGQVTGEMALCLRRATGRNMLLVLLETVPRLLYPLGVICMAMSLIGFWSIFLWPKMEKMFADFKTRLPEATIYLSQIWTYVSVGVMGFILLVGLPTLSALILSSTACWYWPGISWVYRQYIRGQVLSLLGILLEAGKPVPEALSLLADADFFAGVVGRKLILVNQAVRDGQPLGPSLAKVGLLPAAMVPLIQAAERVQNVPWVLGELGDFFSQLWARRLRRLSLVMFPIVIVLLSVLIGYSVVAMFLPLIDLLWYMMP